MGKPTRNCSIRPVADRFWEKVDKTEGCWLWLGSRNPSGHGQFNLGRRGAGMALAHRWSWEFHHGPVGVRFTLTQTCGERTCVRPDHMRIVSSGATFADRFWSRVQKTDGCWLWTGSTQQAGYGTVNVGGGKFDRAHRVAWRLSRGADADKFVCHRCDNPRCVRPDHLFLGTHEENMADMRAKGRSRTGSKNPLAKLTDADVFAIRCSHAMGIPRASIANRHGIGRGTVTKIVARRAWRHVGAIWRRVVVEHPLAGDVEGNIAYAKRCMRDCLSRGEAPYASALILARTGILDDAVRADREMGMEVGFVWGERADLIAVYADRGVSNGMRAGIERALARGIPIEERWLDGKPEGGEAA